MLFGKEEIIQSALPHFKIDALVRKNDIHRYDDRENIRCNLISAYEILMNFVAKHLPDKFYLEQDRRVSLREKIFREIIANFLIHREYTNAHTATFIIYKDRVETRNANKPHLLAHLEPGKFEPFPKNPNIAKFFVQMARAEDLGTGISNVFRYLKPYAGTMPVFREEDLFIVEVPLGDKLLSSETEEITVEKTVENVEKTVEKTVEKAEESILNLISVNPTITIATLQKTLKLTRRKVEWQVKNLKDKGFLKRVGTDRAGHWIVNVTDRGHR